MLVTSHSYVIPVQAEIQKHVLVTNRGSTHSQNGMAPPDKPISSPAFCPVPSPTAPLE